MTSIDKCQFTKSSYAPGETMKLDCWWTGAGTCSGWGSWLTARYRIKNSAGTILNENHTMNVNCNDCFVTWTTNTPGTYTGELDVWVTGCAEYLHAEDTCTVSQQPTTYVLTVQNNPTGMGQVQVVPSSGGSYICAQSTCSWTLEAGTTVTLTASPYTGYLFNGWNGSCSGTGTCYVTMNQNRTVAANWSQLTTVNLIIENYPTEGGYCTWSYGGNSGTCDASSCTIPVPSGTTVTITQHPKTGWTFWYWQSPNNQQGYSCGCGGSGSTCQCYLDATTGSKTIQAHFQGPPVTGACCVGTTCHPDTTASECMDMNGHWQGDWTECSPNPCQGACCIGETCQEIDERWCYYVQGGDNWLQGLSCSPTNPCGGPPPPVTGSAEFTICPTGLNQPITAYFTWNGAIQPTMDDIAYMYIKRPDQTIAAYWVEDTYGSTTGTKELTATADQEGTWTAHIDIAYHHDNIMDWVSYEDTCTISSHILTLLISPETGGQITANPDWETYPTGTQVELTAQSSLGYQFDYWTGDLTGQTNPITITMNKDKTITAHFKNLAEVTCYGCTEYGEVKSQSYPFGTTCSETSTPGYPHTIYPDCGGTGITKYLPYIGAGLIAVGIVTYLVKRRTKTVFYSPPSTKKQRTTRKTDKKTKP